MGIDAKKLTVAELREQNLKEVTAITLGTSGLTFLLAIATAFWAGENQLSCLWIAFGQNPKALVTFAAVVAACGFLLLHKIFKMKV